MQIIALVFWLGLTFLVSKCVNFLAKRPIMNPWTWFAASYAISYIVGIAVGAVRGNPNLAYIAGSFFPITVLAVGLGMWQAPKWRAKTSNAGCSHANSVEAASEH